MNNLLPKKEELLPIKDKNSTFYECGFNQDFDSLPFQKRLEIVNDIIRQTILPTSKPNPANHTETLIGDCHTAALSSIEYLKYLELGKNHRYVMGRIRPFEPSDITSTHALVLLDDEEGNTYQFDATPYVGYKYGKVSLLSKERFYLEYTDVGAELRELLDEIRNLMLLDHKGFINECNFQYFKSVMIRAMKHKILHGYTSKCAKILSKYETDINSKEQLLKTAYAFNPYDKENFRNQIGIKDKNNRLLHQIEEWRIELSDLKKNNKNLKRQIELAQLMHEIKFIDESYEKYLKINATEKRFSHITPRFMFEEKLTAIMIKPSAYFTNTDAYIEKKMCEGATRVVGTYEIDLSKKTKDTGLKPMLFSHPAGEDYIRSMSGQTKVMLVGKDSKDLYKTKKKLRDKLGKDLYYKNVIWYDGEKILWHPYVTNYVHSADHPSESSLHYLIGYPEHQLMTRFMYPNLKLEMRP